MWYLCLLPGALSLVMNFPIACSMHSPSPLCYQTSDTWESSPLLQWESWISTLSTYIISLAILFLYSFYYYALGMGSIRFTFPGHLRLWHVTGMSQQLSTMLPFSLVSYTCCQATPLYLDTYHRLQRNNLSTQVCSRSWIITFSVFNSATGSFT